jgi:hypothetical protein
MAEFQSIQIRVAAGAARVDAAAGAARVDAARRIMRGVRIEAMEDA